MLSLCVFSGQAFLHAQTTANDGDWASKDTSISNTPEADLMVRTGDIDNLGFAWPTNFDPFSGNNTPVHAYPWTPDTLDPGGTDRIMVISSYNGTPPSGRDGYTNGTSRPENSVRPIDLTFSFTGTITDARLQLFVDDFQAPVWGANYEVTLDSIRIPDLEFLINNLQQTGPIGKVINFSFPPNLLYLLNDGKLSVEFDDHTTGAGDGYAIDFIKLLINPKELQQTAQVYGTITDAISGNPLDSVEVIANSLVSTYTDASGNYLLSGISPGVVQLTTVKGGYGQEQAILTLVQGDSVQQNFQLQTPAPKLVYHYPADGAFSVDTASWIKLVFDQSMDTNTFNSSSFILTDSFTTVNGTFFSCGDTLCFEPNSLEEDQMYFVTVTPALANTFGISIQQATSFQFSTGEPSVSLDRAYEQMNDRLHVYPNPAQTMVWIEVEAEPGSNWQVELMTLQGQVIHSEELHVSSDSHMLTWEVGEFPSATYLIQVTGRHARMIRKLVIIH